MLSLLEWLTHNSSKSVLNQTQCRNNLGNPHLRHSQAKRHQVLTTATQRKIGCLSYVIHMCPPSSAPRKFIPRSITRRVTVQYIPLIPRNATDPSPPVTALRRATLATLDPGKLLSALR